jgi:hypothetical protein
LEPRALANIVLCFTLWLDLSIFKDFRGQRVGPGRDL